MAQTLRNTTAAPGGHGRPASARSSRGPLTGIRVAVPFLLVLAPFLAVSVRVLHIGPPISFWGDQALTDIAARRALTLHELLGPYSRFGWHHPGPSWLFLLGGLTWIGGGTTAVATVAAVAVHAAAGLLTVLAGRRLGGEGGAWVAAVAVLAVTQTLGIAERVAYIWNPWAIVLPALLYIALCALLGDRTRSAIPPGVAVLLCGSFLVQTHVGSVVLVVLLPLVAVAIRAFEWFAYRRRYLENPPRPPALPRRAVVLSAAGAVALVLVWTPPLIQQFTHHPGNMTELLRYAREPHGEHTAREALVAVGNELRAFPFLKDTPERFQESNNGIYVHMGRRYEYTPYAYLLAAAALVGVALWRRDRRAVILAVLGAATVLLGVQSVRMADGLLYVYLVAWTGVAAVPIWAAAASLVAGAVARHVRSTRTRRLVATGLAVVVGLVSAVCVYQSVHDQELEPHLTFPAGLETAELVGPTLAANRGPVLLHLATGGAMPVAAAIADRLDRSGRPWRVNREFVFMFGEASKPQGDETIELYLQRIEDNLPSPDGGRELGIVRNTRVFVMDRG